jgi:hypothetical protein
VISKEKLIRNHEEEKKIKNGSMLSMEGKRDDT